MMANTQKSKTSLSLRLFTGTYLFPFLSECFLRSHQGTTGKPAGDQETPKRSLTEFVLSASQGCLTYSNRASLSLR
jgi:hypothetical protein